MANVSSNAQSRKAEIWGQDLALLEPPGIVLRNNHCYRNALFAALFHIPQFMLFLEIFHAARDPTMIIKELDLRRIFHLLAEAYWDPSNRTLTELQEPLKEMTEVINNYDARLDRVGGELIVGMKKHYFQGGPASQQDVTELLMWVLFNLTFDKSHAGFPIEDIEDLFRIQTVGQWTCGSCQKIYPMRNGNTEDFTGAKPITVSSEGERVTFLNFLHSRWLRDADVERECLTCLERGLGGLQKGTSEEFFASLPEYLMFQLSSFGTRIVQTSRWGERSLEVKFPPNMNIPLWLDLSSYAAASVDGSKDAFRYKLWSTVYHTGKPDGGGHYHGVFTGPQGVRSIDNSSVYNSGAMHLTNFYPFDDRAVIDHRSTENLGGGAHRFESRTRSDSLPRPQRIETNIYGETEGTTPYLLVYKRIGESKTRQYYDPVPSKASSPRSSKQSSPSSLGKPGSAASRRSSVNRSPPYHGSPSSPSQGSKRKVSSLKTTNEHSASSKGQSSESRASSAAKDELHGEETSRKRQKTSPTPGKGSPDNVARRTRAGSKNLREVSGPRNEKAVKPKAKSKRASPTQQANVSVSRGPRTRSRAVKDAKRSRR